MITLWQRIPRRVWPWMMGSLVIGTLARLWGVGVTQSLLGDEYYYVCAAQNIAGIPRSGQCIQADNIVTRLGTDPNMWYQPPFGKEWTAWWIHWFGNSAWVWRTPEVILGVSGIVAVGWLAWLIWEDWRIVATAMMAMAVDGMAIATSRIDILDSTGDPLIWWSMVAAVIVWKIAVRDSRWAWKPAVVTGLLLGFATATKWNGVQAWLVVGALWIWAVIANRLHHRTLSLRWTVWLAGVGVLLVVPLGVYVATYLPLAVHHWGFQSTGFFSSWWVLQHDMVENMWALQVFDPWTSSMWQWVTLPRPMLFSYFYQGSDKLQLYELPNILLVWMADLAVISSMAVAVWSFVKSRRRARSPRQKSRITTLVPSDRAWIDVVDQWMPIWLGILGLFISWVVSQREEYVYYFLAPIPFFYLALSKQLWAVWDWFQDVGVVVLTIAVMATLAGMLYLGPLWVEFPMPSQFYQQHFWPHRWDPLSKIETPTTKNGTVTLTKTVYTNTRSSSTSTVTR